jgi:hypothetical protein
MDDSLYTSLIQCCSRWDVCDAPHHITLYQNMMWTSCGGINSSTAGVVKYGIGLSNGQTVISDSSTSFGKLGNKCAHKSTKLLVHSV